LNFSLENNYAVLSDNVIPILARYGETKLNCTFDMPEYIEDCKLAASWYKEGYLPKDIAIMKDETKNAYFTDGKVFCKFDGMNPTTASGMSTDNVKYIQKQMTDAHYGITNLNGGQYTVSRTSKNPERSLMLLDAVHSDKTLNNILAYGIENKNYTKVSDNVVHILPNTGYDNSWQWAYPNNILNYLKDTDPPDKYDQLKKFADSCTPDPSTGFKFNTEKYNTVISATKTITGENLLINGVYADIDSRVAKVRKELQDCGFYSFMDDVQKAFDEWLASKK